MPDVGAAEPWNAGLVAPDAGDFLFVHSKIRFVRGDVAATAELDARHPPDRRIAGDVKQRPVDPVHGLRHLLQHQHMAVEVGLQRRAKQLAKDRDVECRCLVRATDRRLQGFRRPIDHPGQRPPDCRVTPIPEDVLHHRTMRHGLEPGPVQSGKQRAGIAITQIGFSSGRLLQPAHHRLYHAARAVTAAGEPHRVGVVVIGDLEEGPRAGLVIAREMPVRQEALGMKENLRPSVRIQRSGHCPHFVGDVRRNARSWCDDGDPALLVAHRLACVALHRRRL